MTLRTTLLGATALGLLISTGAYAAPIVAGGNTTDLSQSGSANSASIDQSGASNSTAGDTSANHALNQIGNGNVLTITQTGNDNAVVRDAYSLGYAEQDQISSSVTNAHNAATLSQGSGSDNTINILFQTQAGAGNTATVTQTGSYNWVTYLDQESSNLNNTNATPNSITATFEGNGNGAASETADAGHGTLTGGAGVFGVPDGTLRQVNETSNGSPEANLGSAGNVIDLDIKGNDNQYAMVQKGNGNTTGTVGLDGNSNQFGSYQTGVQNQIVAGTVTGSSNNIVVYQSGNTNSAQVTSLGLASDFNQIAISQVGSSNIGTTTIDGSSNVAAIIQKGASNGATVSLTGNSNGAGLFGSGDAAALLLSGSIGLLTEGTVNQGTSLIASNNDSANYTVYGSDNLYALAQYGSSDTINGTVGTAGHNSDGNEAAVWQTGSTDTTTFNQTGTGSNVVSVKQ